MSTVAITAVKERLFIAIGTVSGHIFFTDFTPFSSSIPVNTSHEVNKGFESKVVNELRAINQNIFALGGNGVLALLEIVLNNEKAVHVVSARPVCPWLHGFNPCSFSPDNRLILGFHGNNFHAVDIRLCDTVCTVPCGGIHRQWFFTLRPNYDVPRRYDFKHRRATFEFLLHGVIVSLDLYLKPLYFIAPRCHRTEIVAICLISDAEEKTYLATAGADHFIQIMEIYSLEGWNVHLSLFNRFKPTCVYSCISYDSFLIVVGGEKGTVVLWRVSFSDLETGESYNVPSIHYQRKGCSARVTDIAIRKISNDPLQKCYCAVAFGDGMIECLEIVGFQKNSCHFEKVFSSEKVCSALKSPNYSIFTKVVSWIGKNSICFCAASTSGNIFVWEESSFSNAKFSLTIPVERCGLSAMAYQNSENIHGFLAVGSESGAVHVFAVSNNVLKKLKIIEYHISTVTGIALNVTRTCLEVVSVALDCILAVHSVDISLDSVHFIRAIPLSVSDPSSLILTRHGAVVVGSGLQLIPSEEWTD